MASLAAKPLSAVEVQAIPVMDTIFALSTGAPPSGIGIIRITGPQVRAALLAIAGTVPEPRRAQRARFSNGNGEVLDDGLVLFFAGPRSVTGEDLGELHCHGGRAVIAALEKALGAIPGCRRAEPGEFTRRAFANGRIDLAEAEGLADLLSAETELQRRSAVAMAGGALSRKAENWRERVLLASARIEAVLDFEDEDDVAALPSSFSDNLASFAGELQSAVNAPHAEKLKEGYRIAIAGPPNAGKSTLFNALTNSAAAITADLAGTTRDVLERPVALEGIPLTFVDMAGLRDAAGDAIEAIGIERAQAELAKADLVLWLGAESEGPAGCWEIAAQVDRESGEPKLSPRHRISAITGEGMQYLRADLIAHARTAMPGPQEVALNARQRDLLVRAAGAINEAGHEHDPLLAAEQLRLARAAFDALLGRTATEDVLDTLFGRFCIGK